MSLSSMPEEASIPLTNLVICIIYLLPHIVAFSRPNLHISVPIFNPVFCFLEQLACTLWCPYLAAGESVRAGEPAARRTTGNCRSGPTNETYGPANSPKDGPDITSITNNPHRKRKRKDDDNKGPPETKRLDAGQQSSPFACPFYLHDPYGCYNCLRTYTLNRIVDVRQHLHRAHALAPQCPVCGEEFGDISNESVSAEDRCNIHIQLQTCESPPSPIQPRLGLTRDDLEEVRKVAMRRTRNGLGATDLQAEKWFEIWDIIFPGVPRPASPYIRDHADIQRIRDMNHGIFSGEDWRGLTSSTREGSPSLPSLSRNALMTIADRLVAMYRRMYPGSGLPAPAAGTSTVDDTPVARPVDHSLQQPHGFDGLVTPNPIVQATEGPLQSFQPAPTPARDGQWPLNSQGTQGYRAPDSRRHGDEMPHMSQPLSPFAPNPDFSMDTQIETQIEGSMFSFEDIDDLLEPPARPGSPSQFFDNANYGPNPSGFWGHPGDPPDGAGPG